MILFILLLPTMWSCNKVGQTEAESLTKMVALADSINHSNPKQADSLYRIILHDAQGKYETQYARALMGLSAVMSNQGNFDSALVLLSLAFESAQSEEDTTLLMQGLIFKGNLYLDQGKWEGAETCFDEGLKLAEKSGAERQTYRFLLGLGTVQMQRGAYPQAVKSFTEGVKITRELHDEENEANALVNLSITLARLGEKQTALNYMNQAVALRKRLNLTREYADGLQNLGIMYKNDDRCDSALLAYQSALDIFNQMGDTVNSVKVRYNIGIILKNQKQYDQAEAMMNEILHFCRRRKIVYGEVLAFSSLSSVYEQTNRMERALTAIDSSVFLAKHNGMTASLPALLLHRHEILAGLGRYKEGYQAALEAQKLSDSLLSIEKQKEIAALSLKFQTDQKESENKLLKRDLEVERFRNLLLVIGLLLGVVLLGVLGYFLRNRHLRAKQKLLLLEERTERINQEKINREVELEKITLQNQISEQELVYQSLVQADLSRVNKSIGELLTPFTHRFTRKKDREEYTLALHSITHAASKDPMAEFDMIFRQIHVSFYEKLLAICNDFSKTELQVAGLLRLNLSSKDIARLTNLNINSIEMTRYHIRKKLKMEQGENLMVFLMTL